MTKKSHDGISPYQGDGYRNPTAKARHERERRAQSRKRRQQRNADIEAKLMPFFIAMTVVVALFAASVYAPDP